MISRYLVFQALCILFCMSTYVPASLAQAVDLAALYERAAAEGEVSAYL